MIPTSPHPSLKASEDTVKLRRTSHMESPVKKQEFYSKIRNIPR